VPVIDTATNNVVATATAGNTPYGVAITPDGTRVYVTNYADNTVSVINTATNTAVATVPVGSGPWGVAITPQGTRVYVTNQNSSEVCDLKPTSITLRDSVKSRAWLRFRNC